ncbi:DUF1992 domain-containing protein [Luteipulveratus mongoliensis]|uniref:DnaJ homologue subfamily C member 28 conserved domain-containing protein n=1 Tax=Luteipulveratus mongoliensis TaxID=571913 RepID=A0A0K1JFD3_9MICO|nr:DUF1992 domain-containing protein [Luteipulveratus mongoliensis]AKU15300.1 hypothetical protein VV02_04540 [Luteipulveratus mongoliensis]
MGYREGEIDRIIREAQDRGDFDDLPGTGKPLDLGDPNDPDWWVKRWVQREGIDTSTVLPPALALRKERQSFPETLLDLATEASVRTVLEDYNRRVRYENLQPTFGRLSRPITAGVDVDDLIAQWRTLRAERTARIAAGPPPPQPPLIRRHWWQLWRPRT